MEPLATQINASVAIFVLKCPIFDCSFYQATIGNTKHLTPKNRGFGLPLDTHKTHAVLCCLNSVPHIALKIPSCQGSLTSQTTVPQCFQFLQHSCVTGKGESIYFHLSVPMYLKERFERQDKFTLGWIGVCQELFSTFFLNGNFKVQHAVKKLGTFSQNKVF